MAKNTPPRILPKVQYDPPFNSGEAYAGERGLRGAGEFNPMNYYNPLERVQPQGMMDMGGGQTAYPNPAYDPFSGASPVPQTPNIFGMTPPNANKVTYNPTLFGQAGTPNTAINDRNAFMNNAGAGAGQPPTNTTPPTAPTSGEMAGPANDQTVAAWQATLDKNQNLQQQARDTGNDKELARLQAEWDRIAPKAQKYGITADRLVNSYMQPGNPAAESSLDRALGRAIADDTWANAATIAFGRPPNELEWKEHWEAMNRGGRDPLEGHPQSIQLIQQKMQEIQQENQNEAFGQYQQWLNSQA